MTQPVQRIEDQITSLPEVGDVIRRQARRIDEKQARIAALQREVDADRAALFEDIKVDWTAEELAAAGLFI